MLATLCEARRVAERGGDVAEVFAGAHAALHDTARELQDRDERTVAADLLEAKQRVEAVVADDPPPEGLPDRLAELIEAVRAGLESLGEPAAACR